jgi:predicted DCC family thiol-disulfide oxidoreductase YuxK
LCRASVRRLGAKTGETLDYLPAQDASTKARFPQVSWQDLDAAVHLFDTDGWVYSGAEAIARALAHGQPRPLIVPPRPPSPEGDAAKPKDKLPTHRCA